MPGNTIGMLMILYQASYPFLQQCKKQSDIYEVHSS